MKLLIDVFRTWVRFPRVPQNFKMIEKKHTKRMARDVIGWTLDKTFMYLKSNGLTVYVRKIDNSVNRTNEPNESDVIVDVINGIVISTETLYDQDKKGKNYVSDNRKPIRRNKKLRTNNKRVRTK